MPPNDSVVKLRFEPGEYLCTWHLPSRDGTITLHLPGSITVGADRVPEGIVHGDVPLEMHASGMVTFPQSTKYKALKLTLANGGEGVLLEAAARWGTGVGYISGAVMTLAQGSGLTTWNESEVEAASEDECFLYKEVELQIGALDALMGVAPIAIKTDPRTAFANGRYTWTSVTNPESSLEWTDEQGHTLKAWYRSKINTDDFYNVTIRYAPVVRVSFARPVDLRGVIEQWLDPLRGIASVATGRSQPVHSLKVRPDGDDGAPWGLAQVFGTALTQAPVDSTARQVNKAGSVVRCAADGVSLMSMLCAWRRLEAEQHPLIETYAGMLHVQDSHPRSRFLLLIQSIEGMHGHDTREEFEQRTVEHLTTRSEVLAALKGHLAPNQKRYLTRSMSKEPPRSLRSALEAALDLPEDFNKTRAALEACRLVSKLVAEDGGLQPLDALRVARNGLAHGTRGFDAYDLDQVNDILDRLVRAHGLRLLGCPPAIYGRLAMAQDR